MFPEITEFHSLPNALFFLYGMLTMDDWYMYYLDFVQQAPRVSSFRYPTREVDKLILQNVRTPTYALSQCLEFM